MNDNFKHSLEAIYGKFLMAPEKEIQNRIEKELNRCGLMYRVFSRCKSQESAYEKLQRKHQKYTESKTKMQDIVGVRIVLYFKDEIDICIRLLQKIFKQDNYEHDQLDIETFKPQRINYVFKTPEDIFNIPQMLSDACLIDNTFEVQIRTIFSEGWHEVEHDIRYKYKDEWKNELALARELNGIFAVLEMCDNNILAICDQMAYNKYKNCDWESMIRHKFRLRMSSAPLSDKIKKILNQFAQTAGKELFRFDRGEMISFFGEIVIPKTCDNIVFICNELKIHNAELKKITPEILIEKCKKYKDKREK